MRTVLYILTTFSVIGLAFWAYRENYATQQALSDADDLRYEIREAYSRLAVLKAEWIYRSGELPAAARTAAVRDHRRR